MRDGALLEPSSPDTTPDLRPPGLFSHSTMLSWPENWNREHGKGQGPGWGQIFGGPCHRGESGLHRPRKPQDSEQQWHGRVWVERGISESNPHTLTPPHVQLVLTPLGTCFPCKGHFKHGHNEHREKQLLAMETLTQWWCKRPL